MYYRLCVVGLLIWTLWQLVGLIKRRNKPIPAVLAGPFNADTTSDQWQRLLIYLQQHQKSNSAPSKHAGQYLHIFPRTIAYLSTYDRLSYDMNDVNNATPTTYPEAVRHCYSKGTLFIFHCKMEAVAKKKEKTATTESNSNNHAPQPAGVEIVPTITSNSAEEEEISQWHAVAVHVKDGVIGIYDSSFVQAPQSGRLNHMKGIRLVHRFVTALRRRIRVKNIWIDGGGNVDAQCADMTREWVVHEVYHKHGVDLGNWATRNGWVKLKL